MLCCGYTAYGNVHIRLVFIRICALDFPGYRDYPFRLGDLHNVFSRVFLPGWLVRNSLFYFYTCFLIFKHANLFFLSSYGPFASSALAGQSLASKFIFSPYFPRFGIFFWSTVFSLDQGICLGRLFHCLLHKCSKLWVTSGLILSLAVSQLSWRQYLLYNFFL